MINKSNGIAQNIIIIYYNDPTVGTVSVLFTETPPWALDLDHDLNKLFMRRIPFKRSLLVEVPCHALQTQNKRKP